MMSLDVFILTSFLLYLLHILYLVQLSHTCSDFSHLLKVMILETRILHHLIQVLLSSPLMKQLTCHVDNISLIHIFGLSIQWCDLFQVLGADVYLFSVYTFAQVTHFIISYGTWFIALMASPYAVLFPTCLCLILAEFGSSVYISIQFEFH